MQKWHESINNNPKLLCYSMYKTTLCYEKYLDVLDIRRFRYVYTNFRTSCHNLEIENGRYNNVQRQNRKCKLCTTNVVEDEFHFLLCCEFYSDIRNKYIPYKFYQNVNLHKFRLLMSTQHEDTIKSVACYLFYAFKKRQEFINAN